MPKSRHPLGTFAAAALCGCMLSAAAMASEVVDVLSDLQRDFQDGHQQIEKYQSRLDRLELKGEPEKPAETLTRMVAEVQTIGRGEAQAIAALRAKVTKIEDLKANLLLKFPEEQESIERHFYAYQTLLGQAESLHSNIQRELDLARGWLASSLATRADPEVRERLLAAVKARFARREVAMKARAADEAAIAEEEALETPPAPPSATNGILAHPPIPRRAAAPPPSRKKPDAGASVAVDLEQLIQEMER